jgi:hypothetical protein
MKKPKRFAFMAFLTYLLFFNNVFSQESVIFNKVKSTTSITDNQLNNITTVSGSGFKFTSQHSTFALSKTGNNLNGSLSFVSSNGSSLNYAGSIEGTFTSSSKTIGLYFSSVNTHFILIIPGAESHDEFDDNDDPRFNSTAAEAILQSLKQSSIVNNSVEANPSNKLVIFLNAASEEINFSIPKDETIESITITDVNGTKTLVKSKDATNNTVSFSKLKKGNYSLEVKTQTTSRVANFTKY